MKIPVVRVPVSLLLDSGLTLSAKLIWMVSRLHGPGPVAPALLEVRSGLSRPTVLKGIALLEAVGWYSAAPLEPTGATNRAPADPVVTVPGDQFTYAWLSGLTRTSHHTVRRAVRASYRCEI